MADHEKEFYTVRGYALLSQDDNVLTPSMEDYLEMAYRLGKNKGYARIGDLAEALNVQPPSASKMVQKLAEMGYFKYERYGVIEFTNLGRETGEFLLRRHEIIEKFLTMLGPTRRSSFLCNSCSKIKNVMKHTIVSPPKMQNNVAI